MFGTSRRRQCIIKGDKSGSIRKYTANKLGSTVSVDQLQSDHLGLFPQFSGKLTSALIWDAPIMANRFNDLTYVHLTRIIFQEKNLSAK